MKEAIAILHRISEDVTALANCLAAQDVKEDMEPKQEESPIKLEDVRAVLAEISRAGKTAEMKALLGKFGANKLSDVNPKDYRALLESAKEAMNA